MKSDEGLLEELKEATEGLTFMSESDYPVEVIHWAGVSEVNPEYLRQLTGLPADTPVEVTNIDEFFRVAASAAEWKSETELITARRYQALVRLLKESLADPKVYRVGEINMLIYIIGQNSTGGWSGVSTRIVET